MCSVFVLRDQQAHFCCISLINNIFTNLYNLRDELLVGIVKPQRAKSEYPHIILILQELRRKLD